MIVPDCWIFVELKIGFSFEIRFSRERIQVLNRKSLDQVSHSNILLSCLCVRLSDGGRAEHSRCGRGEG